MNHTLKTVLLALAVSLGVFYAMPSRNGAEQVPKQKESTYDRVMRTGTIRCGYGIYAPWLMKDSATGKMSGIVADTVEAAAHNLGLKVEWTEETGWGTMIEALESNRFDVFCAPAAHNATRGKRVAFFRPLAYSRYDVYVRPNDHRFDNKIEAINSPNITIATQDGEQSAVSAATEFPKAKTFAVTQLMDYSTVLLNVAQGKADVGFGEPYVVQEFLKHNPGKLVMVPAYTNEKPWQSFEISVPYRRGEVEFGMMMDGAINELMSQGVFDKIMDKYDPDHLFLRVADPYKMPTNGIGK